jgi:hypothetical protein
MTRTRPARGDRPPDYETWKRAGRYLTRIAPATACRYEAETLQMFSMRSRVGVVRYAPTRAAPSVPR